MSMAQKREPSPAGSNSTSMFSGVSSVYWSALDMDSSLPHLLGAGK